MSKDKQSLRDFVATQRRTMKTAWIEGLPDDIFNEVWDAIHDPDAPVGKVTAAKWLQSLGYKEATGGRLDAMLIRERRQ